MKGDAQTQRDVLDGLEWESSVESSQIGVTAKNGVVTLTGYVSHYPQKLEAERVAKSIIGVRAIANDIQVRLSELHERTDADIAVAAVNALEWHASVPNEMLKVTVRDGWVTLEGKVDWNYQRDAACHAVQHLVGVRGVTELIKISPKTSSAEIDSKIRAAFYRTAEVGARHVRARVEGSKVVLEGKVASWSERAEAERTAWSAPGIADVDNRLAVDEEIAVECLI